MSTLWQGPDLRRCTQGVSRRPQDGDAQRDSKRLFRIGYEPELREDQPVLELAVAVRRLLLRRGGEPILGKHLGDAPASCRLYSGLHLAVDETRHRELRLSSAFPPSRRELTTELWSQKERGGRDGPRDRHHSARLPAAAARVSQRGRKVREIDLDQLDGGYRLAIAASSSSSSRAWRSSSACRCSCAEPASARSSS